MQIPHRKIQRIQNPFDSSQSLTMKISQYYYEESNPNTYQPTKFSNIFQYNDRSRVILSDSQISSTITNNQSGQNIYTFTKYKKSQTVQNIPLFHDQHNNNNQIRIQQNVSSQKSQSEKEQIRFSFKPNPEYTSPETKNIFNKQQNLSTNLQYRQLYKNDSPHKVMFNYQSPQVSKFNKNQPVFIKKQQVIFAPFPSQSTNIKSSNNLTNKIQITKKTFKPTFLNKQKQNRSSSKQRSFSKGIQITNSKKYIPLKMQKQKEQQNIDKKQRIKQIQIQNSLNQQILKQNLDIFQTHNSVKVLNKDFLKNQKFNLQSGNQVQFNYSKNILDELKKQNYIQKQKVNTSKRQSQSRQSLSLSSQKIIQSHFYSEQRSKSPLNKKKRKKIFDAKYSIADKKIMTSERQNNHIINSVQVQRAKPQQYGCPHTKCLIKSLQIIDKLAIPLQQKKFIHPSQCQTKLEHSQVQAEYQNLSKFSKKNNIINPEQQKIKEQLLQINFELTNFDSLFQLQNFDSQQSIQKLMWLNQASIKVYQRFKYFYMSQSQSQSQKTSSLKDELIQLKQQTLNIRQKVSKLLKWYQKYTESKQILQKLQKQIKQVLLLGSQQKYKKIKLLNQVITVLQKTQAYLSMQNKHIPIMIKNYVNKEKILIQELREWLKECFKSQKNK